MLRRVMPDLMGLKNIMVLNDEAHHCYREKPKQSDDNEEANLKGDGARERDPEVMRCVPIRHTL